MNFTVLGKAAHEVEYANDKNGRCCSARMHRSTAAFLLTRVTSQNRGMIMRKTINVCISASLSLVLVLLMSPAVLGVGVVTPLADGATPGPALPALTSATDGGDLVGAIVTVFYDPGLPGTPVGAIESEVMLPAGPGASMATSSAGLWTFSMSGPIFSSPFSLVATGMSTQGIDFIEIDLLPGGNVWDKTTPSPGTPGSAGGLTFEPAGPGAPGSFTGGVDALGSWDVDYFYDVVPGGSAGDVFGKLIIDFVGNSPLGVFDSGDVMDFVADTDLIIPEPATLCLMAIGMAACGLRRRR